MNISFEYLEQKAVGPGRGSAPHAISPKKGCRVDRAERIHLPGRLYWWIRSARSTLRFRRRIQHRL